MARHGDQTVAKGIHVIHAFDFASVAAMTASAGFTNADVGKGIRITNDASFHLLSGVSQTTGTGTFVALENIATSAAKLSVAQRLNTSVAAGTLAGGPFELLPSDYADGATFSFLGVGYVSHAGLTMNMGLFNVDDSEFVAGATLQFTGIAPGLVTSAALTVGSDAGDLRDSSTIYEPRIVVDGGAGSTSLGILGSAQIMVDI